MSLTFTPNAFLGLWQGPIDHRASSIVNATFDPNDSTFPLKIGDIVYLRPPGINELLPRVDWVKNPTEALLFYGVAVRGDADGIYPNEGSGFLNSETIKLSTVANVIGDGVGVCTQGRCVAKIDPNDNSIEIGDALTVRNTASLEKAVSGRPIVARALQPVAQKTTLEVQSFAAVDIQREGIAP